ncbi:MAG TPA: hypothetical protein VHO91_22825 [Rhodopila sp.]|nr:hypothetical protein [Rhodopila sp.]
MSDHGTAIWHIAHTSTRARRQDLLAAFVAQCGWTVQAGPFAGMAMSERAAWQDGNLLPMLLGCYEAELHGVLEEVIAAVPDLVLNIGAGEGYYAVGLARWLPNTFVHAFDPAPEAQDACRATAALNNASQRISVAGACSPDLLNALLPRGRTPLILSDCEGHERDLINPARIPLLRTATLIVECHDFIDASITNTLAERLNPTHELVAITESARNPNESAFLSGLNSLDRWLAVCEYRPTRMHWLVARPRA